MPAASQDRAPALGADRQRRAQHPAVGQGEVAAPGVDFEVGRGHRRDHQDLDAGGDHGGERPARMWRFSIM
jgi:hypothetical protein